jgi:2-polyprenyl-3-methyl-5-hydroxy-6-metoxy-1,4-benzoquinol methylase
VPKFAALPEPAHVVVCTDVLEHVEPAYLDDVLRHLAECTVTVAHVVIATKPDGNKRLADGRDPHLIVRPAEWWRAKLNLYMRARLINTTARDCTFRARPGVQR